MAGAPKLETVLTLAELLGDPARVSALPKDAIAEQQGQIAKRGVLTPELKAFIDRAIVPALVKAYLAEAPSENTLASHDSSSDNRTAVEFGSTERNKCT